MSFIQKKLGAACGCALLLFSAAGLTAQEKKAEPPKVTLTEAQMAALDGQYSETIEPDIVLSVYRSAGSLIFTRTRQAR